MSSLPMTEVRNEAVAPVQGRNSVSPRSTVLVCLPSITEGGLSALAKALPASFADSDFLIASLYAGTDSLDGDSRVRMIEYPAQPPHSGWVLTASDYLIAASLALEHKAAATLLLGTEAATLSSEALQTMCAAALQGGGDLVLPRYQVGPHEGLVTAALLHPLSRALFGVAAHIPLPLDVAFSARMASRFSVAAKRPPNVPGSEPLMWPASEAAVASFVIHEVSAGRRTLPQPNVDDLNTLLAQLAGSLFADIEAKASFWQRARSVPPAPQSNTTTPPQIQGSHDMDEVRHMAADFRNAFTNLQEIWSLVLPPQSLLALKKLALASPEAFTMPANLWARTVYDFVLSYRLRTINRGHLLGALTPLYLAWVASHLRIADDNEDRAERHIEETAAAFTAEKAYIVSRWRWPDRFNP